MAPTMTDFDISISHPAGVFGLPPLELVEISPDVRQFSPLIPGSASLEDVPVTSLAAMTMYAVPSTIERRRDLALMLRALRPGARFTALAPKDMGGSRLRAELVAFGCTVDESAKRHHRICAGERPDTLCGLDAAIAEGNPLRLDDLGLWSQPGIFSWNRLDPGTSQLLDALPALHGVGADLGCGNGVLAHGILASSDVERLHLVDLDRRGVEAARRNVDDARAVFHWEDVRRGLPFEKIDFVVMNPPFHDAGSESKGLGTAFIERAAGVLRTGGALWLVANRHLPYEKVLRALFRRNETMVEAHGFKVFMAQK